jgi:hypothetical protein
VEPSKVDPKKILLTGVWGSMADEWARIGNPPRMGGIFSKRLE